MEMYVFFVKIFENFYEIFLLIFCIDFFGWFFDWFCVWCSRWTCHIIFFWILRLKWSKSPTRKLSRPTSCSCARWEWTGYGSALWTTIGPWRRWRRRCTCFTSRTTTTRCTTAWNSATWTRSSIRRHACRYIELTRAVPIAGVNDAIPCVRVRHCIWCRVSRTTKFWVRPSPRRSTKTAAKRHAEIRCSGIQCGPDSCSTRATPTAMPTTSLMWISSGRWLLWCRPPVSGHISFLYRPFYFWNFFQTQKFAFRHWCIQLIDWLIYLFHSPHSPEATGKQQSVVADWLIDLFNNTHSPEVTGKWQSVVADS